jgi:hypothetical protein
LTTQTLGTWVPVPVKAIMVVHIYRFMSLGLYDGPKGPTITCIKFIAKLKVKSSLRLIIYYCMNAVRSWLRHYATSRKITGSIPDEVIGFFT